MFEEFMKLHSANLEKETEISPENETNNSDNEEDEVPVVEVPESNPDKLALKEISDKEV